MKNIVLILMLLSASIFADEMDLLLEEFAQESDLSEDTKKENSGELILFTRNDIEKMQIRSLKELIQSVPFFGYKENRYGNPDLFNLGPLYSSSNLVRIYIDNQEISIGILSTAYETFGNINIDFVDHAEIYMISPSYENSVEAATLLVKLYSKNALRDEGGRASLRYGSRNTHQETLSYAKKLDSFEYYAYGSNVVENRMKYDSLMGQNKQSKDRKDIHLFATLKTDVDTLQLHYLKREADAFVSVSPMATAIDTELNIEYFHIGYERELPKGFHLLLSYDKTDYKLQHQDQFDLQPPLNIYDFNNKIEDEVYTAKLDYITNIGSNKLLLGVKYRLNNFKNQEYFSSIQLPQKEFDRLSTVTAYAENKYKISDKSVISAGLKYVNINSNANSNANNINSSYFSTRLGYGHL